MEPQQSFPYSVIIDWNRLDKNEMGHNDVYAQVLSIFGLPGIRYLYTPSIDYMSFRFKSEKDALIFKLMISENL